jgi:peptidyl-prolyl cis-trans isomerase D
MGMMGWMRRTSRYFLIAVVVTFVASLAYFGATQDRGPAEWVVKVNGESVSAVTYQRTYRNVLEQARQAFGPRWSPELERALNLREQVLERLVADRVIAQRAEAEGVQISDAELADQITRIPAFRDGGRFSRDRYLQVLKRNGLEVAAFEADLRLELVRQKLQGLVADGARVSEAEARQHWETTREKVRATYLRVAAEPVPASFTAPDAELEAYHKAHPAEFTPPERRRVLLAHLPGSSVPVPVPTDAEVETAYQERRGQFETPGRARVAHILVRVPTVGGSQAEDAARAKAEAALGRVRGGADFGQVAREVSEDAGTASKGGELGTFAAGELTPELDQAIAKLKAGELAGPVRTPFGFHVIKVLEVTPASRRELKEVATTLRATLAAEGQLRALRDRADEAQRALLTAADFTAEARKRGLTVRELGPLARTDTLAGLGPVAEATDAIFALAPDGVSAPIKVTDGYAVFKLVERQESRLRPVAEARADVLRAVGREKAQQAALAKARALGAAWRKGEDPRALAKREGATVGELGSLSRVEPATDRDLGPVLGPVALGLPAGAVSEPVVGPQGGVYVVRADARQRADAAGFEAARREVEAQLLQQKRAQLWQGWLAAARAPAKVEVNRQVLPAS